MKIPVTRFSYVGFTEIQGTRVFSYQMSNEDRTKVDLTVAIDLALARSYKISLQELPLMCRSVLDNQQDFDTVRSYSLSEQQMQMHAHRLAERAEEAKRKRPPRRPHNPQATGSAWRAFPLSPTDGSRP